MYSLVPNHTTPGKKTVKIRILPDQLIQGYYLWVDGEEEYIDGSIIDISHNGHYRVKIVGKDDLVEEHNFVISFLSKKITFSAGDGSSEDPYQISTLEQLNAVRLKLSAHYVLSANIDLSQWGLTWIPIGKYVPHRENLNMKKAFSGTFNGLGFKLQNLSCWAACNVASDEDINETGLFGCCINAVIQNLYLTNCRVFGKTAVGCLASEAQGCHFENCHVSGLSQGFDWAGGLVGNGIELRLDKCSFTGKVIAEYNAAGLCYSADSIRDCEVNAEIASYQPCGVCSSVKTLIEHCIIRGALSGCTEIGGICRSMGAHTRIVGCICALKRVNIETTDIFTSDPPSSIDACVGERLFSFIDIQDCSENEYMNTEYRQNFHCNAVAFNMKRTWSANADLDGLSITPGQLKECAFLRSVSWNIGQVWIIEDDGPHLRK